MADEKNIFCVCYDLKSVEKDYKPLKESIKKLGPWWHHLDNVWFVRTDKSAKEVRDELKYFIGEKDELLVFRFSRPWAGMGFAERAYDWIRKALED